MKKLTLLRLLGIFVCAGSALADPTCSTITTVAQWAALGSGGCTIGLDTFVFQDFIDFSSGPHSTPTENQVTFTPVIDSNGTGFILTYQTPFQANPTGQADIELIYKVTGPDAHKRLPIDHWFGN